MKAVIALLFLAACQSSESRPSAPVAVPGVSVDAGDCLLGVLKAAGLNDYGDPPDTMYAGGSPLFDEATGRTTSRRAYVQARRPDLAAKCPEGP